MSPKSHKYYIGFFVVIAVVITALLILKGYSYYIVVESERFHHPGYDMLKPSGFLGHGYGIVGSLLIVLGVFLYLARKRLKILANVGVLKYWLEFHIFLCSIGPLLVLFHTTFKFGGIVAVSFWSMVAVVISGVLGRFIYLQIPRTIEGRELSLTEVQNMQTDLKNKIVEQYNLDNSIFSILNSEKGSAINALKKELKNKEIKGKELREAISYFKSEKRLERRIRRLGKMQNLFRYWHVAHLPFALIMLIIMVIHVVITLLFGYKWIF